MTYQPLETYMYQFQPVGFFALFVIVCICIALMSRKRHKFYIKPEALAERQLLEARRHHLEHLQSAEYHAAAAEGYAKTVARLSNSTSQIESI